MIAIRSHVKIGSYNLRRVRRQAWREFELSCRQIKNSSFEKCWTTGVFTKNAIET